MVRSRSKKSSNDASVSSASTVPSVLSPTTSSLDLSRSLTNPEKNEYDIQDKQLWQSLNVTSSQASPAENNPLIRNIRAKAGKRF